MTNSALEAISKDRVRLGNPYAHIDVLEEAAPSPRGQVDIQSDKAPSRPRPVAATEKRDRIALEARRVQAALWRSAVRQANGRRPSNPIDVLDPEKALADLGFRVSYKDGLGVFQTGGIKVDVAGILDPDAKLVQIASQFPRRAQRFTLAHELGHLILHDLHGVLHRDRPLNFGDASFDPIETEANRFASYFLMPERIVREEFRSRFLTELFVVTEATAFALAGQSLAEFEGRLRSSRELAMRLATAEQFNGKHFSSLADAFQVSAQAMALRLEQLFLIDSVL